MLAEISSLISTLAVTKDIGAALVNERDRQKAAALQIDLTDKILQAQAQLAQVLGSVIDKDGRIQTLTERVRELEAKQAEQARYRLAKLGTYGEFFAYQLRSASELVERADEPPHFLCQPCFDSGKKGVLRIYENVARCNVCDTSVPLVAPEPIDYSAFGTTRGY